MFQLIWYHVAIFPFIDNFLISNLQVSHLLFVFGHEVYVLRMAAYIFDLIDHLRIESQSSEPALPISLRRCFLKSVYLFVHIENLLLLYSHVVVF